MSADFPQGTILVRRPLHELACLEVPSLQLIILAVTTCVRAIFHHHFYDLSTAIVRTDLGYHWSGRFVNAREFDPKVLRCAVAFVPKNTISMDYGKAANYYKSSDVLNNSSFTRYTFSAWASFVQEKAELA